MPEITMKHLYDKLNNIEKQNKHIIDQNTAIFQHLIDKNAEKLQLKKEQQ